MDKRTSGRDNAIMYVWIDNSDEDIRVSASKRRLKATVENDYMMKDGMKWEERGTSTALVSSIIGEDYREFGVIMKAKVVG